MNYSHSSKRSASSPLQNQAKKMDGAINKDIPLQGMNSQTPLKGSRNTLQKSYISPGRTPSRLSQGSNKENFQGNEPTVQSLQQTMNQKFSQFDMKLTADKSGIIPSLAKLARVIDDGTYGIDAINLRLDALDSDVIHPSGFRAKFAEVAQEIDNLKKDQVQLVANGEQGEVFTTRLSELNEKDAFLEHKMDLMAYKMHSQEEEIHTLKLSIASLVAIHLSVNLFIGGIREMPMEDPKDAAAEFFKQMLGLVPRDGDIVFAERVGINGSLKINGQHTFLPKILKVRLTPEFRDAAWDKKSLLKNKTDTDYHWRYFMDKQRPDIHKAAYKRRSPHMRQIRKDNEGLPADQQKKYNLIGDRFYVDGEEVKDPVSPPTFKELYELPHHVEVMLRNLELQYSQPVHAANNTFTGYSLSVESFQEINLAYQKLKIEEKQATHIMMACSIGYGKERKEWSCDDGEHNGGFEIQKVLSEFQATNVAVFVARWKVGANMGGKRFKCIHEVARHALRKLKMKEEMLQKNDDDDRNKDNNADAVNK